MEEKIHVKNETKKEIPKFFSAVELLNLIREKMKKNEEKEYLPICSPLIQKNSSYPVFSFDVNDYKIFVTQKELENSLKEAQIIQNSFKTENNTKIDIETEENDKNIIENEKEQKIIDFENEKKIPFKIYDDLYVLSVGIGEKHSQEKLIKNTNRINYCFSQFNIKQIFNLHATKKKIFKNISNINDSVDTSSYEERDDQIEEKKQNFEENKKKRNIFIFYFSGKSFTLNGNLYLCPYKFKEKEIKKTAIKLSSLKKKINNLSNFKHSLIILDCENEGNNFSFQITKKKIEECNQISKNITKFENSFLKSCWGIIFSKSKFLEICSISYLLKKVFKNQNNKETFYDLFSLVEEIEKQFQILFPNISENCIEILNLSDTLNLNDQNEEILVSLPTSFENLENSTVLANFENTKQKMKKIRFDITNFKKIEYK